MTLINQENNHAINASDREQVSRLVELSKGNYDAHLVFFKNGKTWIAVADSRNHMLIDCSLADAPASHHTYMTKKTI